MDRRCLNLFEIKKPVGVNAIGVDNLPNHINYSDILSKNDIARLGNIEVIPNVKEIDKFIESNGLEKIISLADEKEKIVLIHKRVRKFLQKNDLQSAILMLFSI